MRDCLDLDDLGHPLEDCLDYFEIRRHMYCGQHHSLAFGPQLYKIRRKKKHRLSMYSLLSLCAPDCGCWLGASSSSPDAPTQ